MSDRIWMPSAHSDLAGSKQVQSFDPPARAASAAGDIFANLSTGDINAALMRR